MTSRVSQLWLYLLKWFFERLRNPPEKNSFFFLRGKFIARHRQVTSMKNGRGPMFPGRLVPIYSSFPRIKKWKKIFKNEEKYGKIADSFNLNSGNFCWILTLETNFLKIVLYGKNWKKIIKIQKKFRKFTDLF